MLGAVTDGRCSFLRRGGGDAGSGDDEPAATTDALRAELETLLCGAAGVTGGEGGRDGGIMKGGRQASLPPAMLVCICAPVCIRSCSMSWPVMPHAACDDAEAVVARAQPPKPVPGPVLGGIGNA